MLRPIFSSFFKFFFFILIEDISHREAEFTKLMYYAMLKCNLLCLNNYCLKQYAPLQSKGGVPQKQLEFAVVESKTLCSNIVCLIPKQSAPLRWFKA